MKSVNETIDLINGDIHEVISHFVSLKKNGVNYKGSCPFHSEKTASFIVSPVKGIYKCFGCGKGGDAVQFIVDHENLEFLDALEHGAKLLNIDFRKAEQDSYNPDEYKRLEGLRIANKYACEFYEEQLRKDKNAREYYTQTRGFELPDDDDLRAGYAPKGNVFLKWAKEKGLKEEVLIDAGLVRTNDKGDKYDTFRNRIVYPICSKGGKILGFTGRTLETKEDVAKWLNTADTDIFKKGNELLGIYVGRNKIAGEDRAYMVEGGFDWKRMHEIGVTNTVAPLGTALTDEQALLLKKYTNKVTLVYDGDEAGLKAMHGNAATLIKHQFYVQVIILPEGEDPDSLFKTREIFDQYNGKQTDYLMYRVEQGKEKATGPIGKSELIKSTTALIAAYDEPVKRSMYIDAVAEILSPKKAWQDQIKEVLTEKPKAEEPQKSYIPKHVNLEEFYRYGFYVENNCYWFKNRGGDDFDTKSNFIMTPLFHIESNVNAKRLYEIKNEHGITRVLEIPQKDMVSLAAFKVRVESLGNFLWQGSEAEFGKVKSWLYEKTLTAKEIVQLGWQKEGFFAWGNGIFNGKYSEADSYGIVQHKEHNYYIPACSSIFKTDENLFEFERRFIHIEGNITLREYVKQFTEVFGDNGRIALIYTFASLFRDVIVRRFDKYPLLNMFGPKGAGKNACAESLLYLFGQRQKVPNLHSTSKAAMGDHVASTSNAICVFDEYRNDLEMEKREFLKGLWDGTGRTRKNMDKDKKNETTSVDQGVIVCGQQMATADIALFSRFVTLSFTKTEYNDDEIKAYERFEERSKMGITHITHQVLKCRKEFKEKYRKAIDGVSEIMVGLIGNTVIETRIFNNWLCIMAAYSVLDEELDFPWDRDETMKIAVELMITQNAEVKKSDDLGTFWKVVQFLISSNLLYDGGDYKTAYVNMVNRRYMEDGKWRTDHVEWAEAKNVFWLTTSRVFGLYKQQCQRQGDKPLPESTVEYYLKNSKAFLFETKKESFIKVDPKTGMQEVKKEKTGEKDEFGVPIEKERKLRTSTTALLFDLDLLPDRLGLERDGAEPEENESPADEQAPHLVKGDDKDDGQADLPF